MRAAIRLARASDGEALAEIYRPAVTSSPVSFEVHPPDGAEMGRRVAGTLERTPWLVCELDGRVAGYAYAGRHRDRPAYQWSVEVSAYVREGARRRGVARALYASLFAALVLQGFRNAYAGITLPNAASVALHESMGFTAIGVFHGIGFKHGAWHDVGWYEHELAPRLLDPPVPRPLPDFLEDAAMRDALASGLRHLRG